MPKIKNNRSAAKRFSKTGNGKTKYKHANARHILTKKTSKRKRQLRKRDFLSDAYKDHIQMLLPCM